VNPLPRIKFHTLTEQMFYILLCLKSECYGLDILDRVPAMTGGRVSVGSGTLYNLLEQFLDAGMIRETRVEGRRRSYIITPQGEDMLRGEYARITAQAADFCRFFGEVQG
jgi:DNA-binding PadR family transcriptional regulator